MRDRVLNSIKNHLENLPNLLKYRAMPNIDKIIAVRVSRSEFAQLFNIVIINDLHLLSCDMYVSDFNVLYKFVGTDEVLDAIQDDSFMEDKFIISGYIYARMDDYLIQIRYERPGYSIFYKQPPIVSIEFFGGKLDKYSKKYINPNMHFDIYDDAINLFCKEGSIKTQINDFLDSMKPKHQINQPQHQPKKKLPNYGSSAKLSIDIDDDFNIMDLYMDYSEYDDKMDIEREKWLY